MDPMELKKCKGDKIEPILVETSVIGLGGKIMSISCYLYTMFFGFQPLPTLTTQCKNRRVKENTHNDRSFNGHSNEDTTKKTMITPKQSHEAKHGFVKVFKAQSSSCS